MDVSRLDGVRASLEASRFEVVEVLVDGEVSERAFAAKVLSALGLWDRPEAPWALFSDRLWDFCSDDGEPLVVLFPNFDRWLSSDLSRAFKCMYGVVSVFDSIASDVEIPSRRVEYVFFADWKNYSHGV
ncbi:hypothetical protein [Nocardiopsis alba]|uniref:hypothetical protein n=1 Tax=Nocardiopsis alba TaxID=53437 RepID=UPI0035D8A273